MATLLLLVRTLITSALACPGAEAVAADAASTTAEAASHSATNARLVGANCSYSTSLMAGRVLKEGSDWSFSGVLKDTSNNLESHVASPFRAEGDGALVIATEILESLVLTGVVGRKVSLEGRVLDVDGVRYAVVTSYRVINS